MTAGFDKKLQVEIEGYNSSFKQIYDVKIEITDAKATLEKLNLQGVYEVYFQPEKEVADPKWQKMGDAGPAMIFDDFSISSIKGSAGASPAHAHAAPGYPSVQAIFDFGPAIDHVGPHPIA